MTNQVTANSSVLKVSDVIISNFDFVLKAYKESFADEIIFQNATLKNFLRVLKKALYVY